MKTQKFFLVLALIFSACEKKEEEVVDIDQMVMVEDESTKHLAGDPNPSPQETLVNPVLKDGE